jgi:hypothetical protein
VKEICEVFFYPRPPAEVFELISSPAFQLELIAHIGGSRAEVVEEVHGPGGSVRLVTRQQTSVELPGFARKLIPANTTVVQTYDWGPPEPDGSRTGTWSAEARGAPVAIGGPTELTADRAGSRHLYGGQVRSSVPVVGGKLEGLALDNLCQELSRTARFTAQRLGVGPRR